MVEGITKEEIRAMVDVQSKNVEQMVVIAQRLGSITENQEKIMNRLYNGMAKEISGFIAKPIEDLQEALDEHIKSVTDNCQTMQTALPAIIQKELVNSDISKDISYTKWFIAIIGLVVVIATITVNALTRRSEEDATIKKVITALSYAHPEVAKNE